MVETLSKMDWKIITIALLSWALALEIIANISNRRALKTFIEQLFITRGVLGMYREIFGFPTDEQIQNAMLKIEAVKNQTQNKVDNDDTPK
jgi:hypothetical protein